MAQTDTASGAPRRRRAAVLRGIGCAVAIALGLLAIWLIATSDTVKSQRIGALAGMWGVLVGAYSIYGARRHDAPADPGTALELRQNAAVARSEDVASQREFQARLEALLRREVSEGVSRELAGLRSEVSALRSEILEKVGGQLRLERTETTRLFGSNLEALQREVNQLKVRQLGDTGVIDAIDESSYRVAATVRETVDAEEIVDAPPTRPAAPEPPPADGFPPFRPLEPLRAFSARTESTADRAAYEPPPAVQPASSAPATAGLAVPSGPLPPPAYSPPAAPAAATMTPTPVAAPPTPAFVGAQAQTPPAAAQDPVPAATPDSAPAASAGDDPFASMPRIRPFTDFELDAVERPAAPWRANTATAAAAPARLSGRHATAGAPAPESAGGRRRRADDSDNDVLAQILAREKPSPSAGEDDQHTP